MEENKLKRKIKDRVFSNLFRDKQYLLQLYQALHPEDNTVVEDEIADVTIKYVLIDADYNDLGLSIGNRLMVLYGSKKVTLPKPELYMIYTGDKKKIPNTISLSEEFFDEKISVNAEIKVLYQENENCKNRNVLKKYLESKEQEVVDIMMTLFDNQQILKAYTKDIKDKTVREAARQMLKKGKMPLTEIAECLLYSWRN